jgi:hypothetical protein
MRFQALTGERGTLGGDKTEPLLLQRSQNLVQQIRYSAEINTVEQIGKCAEQVT